MVYDAIIVGGGPSGIVAAIALSKKNKKVIILEKSNKVGRKILVSGNGRCNLSNKNIDNSFYNVEVSKFLNRFGFDETIEFFSKLGLETYADEEGRIYPISNYATSVYEVLMRRIEKQKVKIVLNEEVVDIKKEENFVASSETEKYFGKNVVFCPGGNNSLQILQNLNVKVNPFRPSLASLECDCPKSLNGIRVSNVEVTLLCRGFEYKEVGEVLFKENAISGIVIFNMSSNLARQAQESAILKIDLLQKDKDALLNDFVARKQNFSEFFVEEFFVGLFKKELASFLLNQTKLNLEKKVSELTEKELRQLVEIVKNLTFKISGICDNNQVFSGGVPLEEVDSHLQSKSVSGLFFAGEILDVDGICGGANLQWAWTSGMIVGENL